MGEGCLLTLPVAVPTGLPVWACGRGSGRVLSSSEAVPSGVGPFSPAGPWQRAQGAQAPVGGRKPTPGWFPPTALTAPFHLLSARSPGEGAHAARLQAQDPPQTCLLCLCV